MLILPIETTDHTKDALIIILKPDNLVRMQEGDPGEIELKAIIKYLKRGWKFHPELGDHDRGPESLKNQN